MKNPELKKLTNDLATIAYGKDAAELMQTGLCIDCKLPALPRCYSNAGKKEVAISGLCELCFDKLFE